MARSRDSGDSAVYRRPLTGGGEATGEDVEGHMMPKAAGGPGLKAAGGPGLRAARSGVRAIGDDDDTEGHVMKAATRASRPALHATRGLVKGSDEDTEGHAMKSTVRARSRAIDGDEDTEGHAMKATVRARSRAIDGDDDTEGHARSR